MKLITQLGQPVVAVLRAPGTAIKGGLKELLRRAKSNSLARKIVLPVLYRYPQLWGPLRRLAEGKTGRRTAPAAALAPGWSGPLPAEFGSMPASARKVLLDLAQPDSAGLAE